MEAVTNKRLHPLLTVAAISITVFSAVGIAALTGVLPHSVGSSKEAAPAALVAAPDIAASVAAPSAAEKPADEVAPMPPAAATSTPAPRPAHRKVVRTPKPVQVAEAPQAQAAPVPPPPPAPIEAPRPVPAGILGVVESVREIKQAAEKSNGVGPIAGGVAGAVVGNQFGKGMTRNVLTVLGAAGGALAGTAVEKNVRATTHWEINVRLDDGSYRTLNSDVAPFWHGGERVRLVDGKLQPA
jgi:outer membrane lipoprotein SlyB